MRSLVYLLLLTVFVSASVTCVSASTECERWYVAYRQELAHSRNIAAAKRRVRRKLAAYRKPAAPAKPVHHYPRMSRPEMVHHVDLACGVLPESDADQPMISEEIPEPFNPEIPMDAIDLIPGVPTGLIAENELPPAPYSSEDRPEFSGPSFPGMPGGPGYFPTGGSRSPHTPPTGTPYSSPPGTPPPPPPPPPPVPEPGSFVLLFTGAAAGLARRRYSA